MIQGVKHTKNIVRKVIKQGKLLNQYLKIKKIGQGPYSKIKLMLNIQDNKFYAMKKYNLFILKKKKKMLKKQNGKVIYTNAAEEVMNQVKILKQVNHKYISKLIQILEDQEQQKVYLFLQYCQNGQISNWDSNKEIFIMNKIIKSVDDIKKAFIEIAEAIKYLHDNDIVHRDLKPQNILLDFEGVIKLIDFGRAVKLQTKQQKLKGSQGTYHFMAPQMLSEVFPDGYDGKICDMWSLGVTFYGILFQKLPFYDELLIKLFQKIEKCQYTFPQNINKQYQVFIPIIEHLLKINSKERLTVDQLIEQLKKIK